jgi:hypothetical protein
METRTLSFELIAKKTSARISVLEVDLAVIKLNYATKEDVASLREEIAKSPATLRKWFIGTAVTISSLTFAVAKFLN